MRMVGQGVGENGGCVGAGSVRLTVPHQHYSKYSEGSGVGGR